MFLCWNGISEHGPGQYMKKEEEKHESCGLYLAFSSDGLSCLSTFGGMYFIACPDKFSYFVVKKRGRRKINMGQIDFLVIGFYLENRVKM